jgi:hypothetical protein
MKTLSQNTRAVGSSAYWGEHGEWFIAYAMHRESDCLTRSNFRCIEKQLRALPAVKERAGDDSPIQIERFSHWAVGWCDYLIIHPECKPAIELADAIIESLDGYPVVNEDDWSELESEEAQTVWRDCYRVKERIEYIREHRSSFEFHSLADLLGCIRGKYFAGQPSELLC